MGLVYRAAYMPTGIGGFTPGTPEFERFKRMALADLFVMGLAGLFPTSLFGASLPAPWSYMQDLSSYFFGDDREKDRAFYGTLPYPLNITKLGMPPAARLLDPVFVAMTGGDWDKFASHTVWTYIPFGRLAKGLSRTIENPTMIAENMFGIPLHDVQTRLRKEGRVPESGNSAEPLVLLDSGPRVRHHWQAFSAEIERLFESADGAVTELAKREGIAEGE